MSLEGTHTPCIYSVTTSICSCTIGGSKGRQPKGITISGVLMWTRFEFYMGMESFLPWRLSWSEMCGICSTISRCSNRTLLWIEKARWLWLTGLKRNVYIGFHEMVLWLGWGGGESVTCKWRKFIFRRLEWQVTHTYKDFSMRPLALFSIALVWIAYFSYVFFVAPEHHHHHERASLFSHGTSFVFFDSLVVLWCSFRVFFGI